MRQHAHEGLQVALRLHVAAHHAEAHLRPAVFGEEGRDDGVKRTLARSDAVRALRIERKAVAAVLHRQAPTRHHDAGAKAHVVALDEAHHHAALVGGGKVDRAAARRVAVAEALRPLRIDELRPCREIRLVEHLRAAQPHAAAQVGDMLVDIGEGQLHRLDLQMLRLGAVDRQRADVEVAQDAERNQRRDALAIGRNLVQAMTPDVEADRVDPFRLVGGEIGQRHRTAVAGRVRRDRLRDLAAIEGLALARGDGAQGTRRGRESEPFADLGRTSLRQKGFGPTGLRLQERCRRDPLLLDHDRHGVAALGDLDRGREQLRERQLAEALGQRHPGRDRARHRHRVPAAHRRAGRIAAILAREILRRPGARRRPRRVEAVQALAVPEDAEHVGAETVAAGLDERHRRGGGDRGIDGIAAACCSLRWRACAASGCEVETTLRANTGRRVDG